MIMGKPIYILHEFTYVFQLLVGEFPCRAFEQANGEDLPVLKIKMTVRLRIIIVTMMLKRN